MPVHDKDIKSLSLQALVEEARRRGLPVGASLGRDMLIELLGSPEKEEEDAIDCVELSSDSVPQDLATLSMVELYIAQGLRREATDLCRIILERNPGDLRILQFIKRLRLEVSPADATIVASPQNFRTSERVVDFALSVQLLSPQREPTMPLPEKRHRRTSWIDAISQTPQSFFALWEIDPNTDELAARRAGRGAVRTIRVVSTWMSKSVAQSTRDIAAIDVLGEQYIAGCREEATHRLAVGWVGESRVFVPICHSEPLGRPTSQLKARKSIWVFAQVSPADSGDSRKLQKLVKRLPPGFLKRSQQETPPDIHQSEKIQQSTNPILWSSGRGP